MSTSPNPKNHLTRVQASTIGNIRGILSYPSVVTIDVDNCGIGLVYRLVQFIILTYINNNKKKVSFNIFFRTNEKKENLLLKLITYSKCERSFSFFTIHYDLNLSKSCGDFE